MTIRRRVLAAFSAICAVAALVPASAAQASISGTSGQILQIAPPASAAVGLNSNTNMWAWDEQQGVTLASAIRVDLTSPGVYDQSGDLLTGVSIPAGTVVDSDYISSVGVANSGSSILDGTLSFPTDILGVMVLAGKLSSSDVLGAPGTDYPGTTGTSYGLEFGTGLDVITMVDQRTITFHSVRQGAGIDEIRVLTRHDGAPTASAGGPYTGVEGTPLMLHGTASDAENDFLTYAWTFTTTSAKPGTVCTPANTNTLTPTITCNDDAVLTARLSVTDPYNPAVITTAQVTINNVAPSLGALTVPTGQLPIADPVSISANFSDAGTHDTHVVTVAWGDTQSETFTPGETNGAGTISRSHIYAVYGVYTITVTITDDDGGVAVRTATVNGNGPPTVSAGGPYTGTEGTAKGLTGTATDPEGDTLYPTWTITPTSQDVGTTCTTTGTSSLTPTVKCDDDAVLHAHLSVTDNINTGITDDTNITIQNVAPVVDSASALPAFIPTGGTINVSGAFHDAATNDTHTVSVNWGDATLTNAGVTETLGAGTFADAHVYTHSGFYTITVTVKDDNGGTAVRTFPVTVNTPPTVDAGGPYVGFEGSPMVMTANAHDVDGDTLTYSWAYSTTGTKPGTICHDTGAGTTSATLTLVCNDDAVVHATVTVSDGVNSPVQSAQATLTVGNENPLAGAVAQLPTAPPGNTVAISVPFSDPGSNDTHTATIDWGDSTTSAGTVNETAGSGTVTGAHNYAVDNHYTVTVTITDDDSGFTTASGSVLSDTTPPQITSAISPPPNGAGWNNSPTAVSWTTVDPLAPITSSTGCDPITRTIDTPVTGVQYTCTATSAGGTASKSVTVKLDQIAPTLTGAATTAPNGNGWYNGPVTVHWSCSDALSGVAGTCPANAVLNSEGSAVSGSATVADVAGNITNASSAPVKIDVTAPATNASTLPEWNNSTVTVLLSATDNLSGVDVTHFVVDGGATQTGTSVLLSDEGVHTVSFWSVDNAGNVESAHTATVKIDKSAPSITVSQSPLANGAGWNKTDVDVSFVCADGLSGVASCSGPQHVSAEGAGQVVTGTASDNAGNSASASRTLNIDKTAPTIGGSVPAANGNGWYNAPVTVTWSCSDGLSGVASCQPATTLSSDGAAQSATGSATDVAGNGATAHVNGINIDQTPPTITATASPAAVFGWYTTGPITVHWTCTDNLSGVTSCPADQVVTNEGFTTLAQTITDQAGNVVTTDITIRIDKTPPTIVGSATPAPNANGWNNTDVQVGFTCADTLSGVATCSSPTTLHEGAAQSVTGHAQDVAGNTASATVSGINVDKTAPTLSGAATTAPNGSGWYNHAVTIHWTCADALSGVDTATCPADGSITTEGAAQQLAGTVSDLAGNAKTASSAPVKVDLTAPVTTASAIPSAYTSSDVLVSLSAIDSLSGVAQTHFVVDGGATQSGTAVTFSTDGVHSLAFWSSDNAGNVEIAHVVTVRIDRSAPTITTAQAPAPNGAGWNNTNVTVTFTCSDADSGIASCTSPQSVTTEGANQGVSGTAVDNAGNTALASTSVSIDKTPPSITGSLSATPNSFGWLKVPVGVSFSCADVLSGVFSCSAPSTFGEGAGQSATGTAKDVAGNTATATVSPINVDLTKPTITATPDRAPDSGGVYSGPVTIHFTCTDALSGIAPGACPADVVVSSDGMTTVSGSTTDRAGNTSSTSATVTLTVQSIRTQKQNVLIQIGDALAAATKHDANILKVARDALAASIDPSLWGAGNHLQEHHGVKVFEKEKQTVDKLTQLLNDSGTSIPAATLTGWITTLTQADRVLATTQLNDAVAGNGTTSAIQLAQSFLAAGDAARAAGDNSGAITNYKNAWKQSEIALGKTPDGGDDPDDH